jgi:A/G-specific adenine glycosylase
MSEIILQQTRVEQGKAYYYKFIEQFPTVFDLANADEMEVLNLWQGLGYYSRARNLHASAKLIVSDFSGIFPEKYQTITQLKGVGPYTAAAIASFAFNERVSVVDGNVYRVLSRIFGIETPIDSTIGKKQFAELAQSLIDDKEPGIHNQAIMEFGALQCVPLNPSCEECPFQTKCFAFEKQMIKTLPVKSKKIAVKNRYFDYLIFSWDAKLILQKRGEKDIWAHLYEFPLIERESFENTVDFTQYCSNQPAFSSEVVKHILSHQHLFVQFHVFYSKPILIGNSWIEIELKDFHNYPIPRVIDRFVESIKLDVPYE